MNKVRMTARIIGEATGKDKDTYKVCFIEAGTGLNKRRYSAELLEACAEQYEGRPMYVDHKMMASDAGEDEADTDRSLKDFVSLAQNVRFDPNYECSTTNGKGALVGEAKVFDPDFRDKLRYPEFRQSIGLSHVVFGTWEAVEENGETIQDAVDIKVESIDWVKNPAMGGRLLESKQKAHKENQMGEYEKRVEAVERRQLVMDAREHAQLIVEADTRLTPGLRQKVVERVAEAQKASAKAINVPQITKAVIEDISEMIREATGAAMPGVSSTLTLESFGPVNTNQFVDKAAEAMDGLFNL